MRRVGCKSLQPSIYPLTHPLKIAQSVPPFSPSHPISDPTPPNCNASWFPLPLTPRARCFNSRPLSACALATRRVSRVRRVSHGTSPDTNGATTESHSNAWFPKGASPAAAVQQASPCAAVRRSCHSCLRMPLGAHGAIPCAASLREALSALAGARCVHRSFPVQPRCGGQ